MGQASPTRTQVLVLIMLNALKPTWRWVSTLVPTPGIANQTLASFPNAKSVAESDSLPSFHLNSYQPNTITHFTRIYPDQSVDLMLVVYFPAPLQFGSLEVRVGNQRWQPLIAPTTGSAYWKLPLKKLTAGTILQFRYQDEDGSWRSLYPLGETQGQYGVTQIPQFYYQWQHSPQTTERAKVLLETTLEGLLAGYRGGRFAPDSLADLQRASLCDRILKTQIPETLATWNIDEIMCPVWASVADRTHLNPKFNYLISNVGAVDWQIGQGRPLMQLIDRLQGCGLTLIPDLIFAHFVKHPFQGSTDEILLSDRPAPLGVDPQPFQFRDYGTHMFDLFDPQVRRILIEKIVSFAFTYRFQWLRFDYVDGLILQYSQRGNNYGQVFLRELCEELQRVMPNLKILGEVFQTTSNEVVQRSINCFYAPRGFSIAEEIYCPPTSQSRPLYPQVERLASAINQGNYWCQEAVYAQLHDETWYCPHITAGRPTVPWAYGANPAQLAKQRGDKLVQMDLLRPIELLDYVRRTVCLTEALTMFLSNQRYMYVPAVDSLSLGRLDDLDRWQVVWEGLHPQDLSEWQQTGLAIGDIFAQHQQHRANMIQLRQIFRTYTRLQSGQACVHPQVYYTDSQSALLGLLRQDQQSPQHSLLILFNLGPQTFRDHYCYELPLPSGLHHCQVLFDGDGSAGYSPGTDMYSTPGIFSNHNNILKLRIGCWSLIVFKYAKKN